MLYESVSKEDFLLGNNKKCSYNEKMIIENNNTRFSSESSNYSFIGKISKDNIENQAKFEYSWRNLTAFANSSANKKNSKNTKNQIYDINDKIEKRNDREYILDNISGAISSGEILAILGGSGSGKTTFLNLISHKSTMKNLKTEGEFFLNHQNIKELKCNINSIISFVPQDDVLEGCLTPKETFLFAMKLKLKNQNLLAHELEKKVSDLIKFLNLSSCKDTRIGDVLNKSISGGERKRTFIGLHLISDPDIIILDEPTTGLDSYNSYQVIKNLGILAKKLNKIVILSIHNPPSELFELFHKVSLLANGKNIFYGKKEAITNYLNNKLGIPLRPNYNPFEHFLEITSIDFLKTNDFKKNVWDSLKRDIYNYSNKRNPTTEEIGLTITEDDSETLILEDMDKYELYSSYIKYLNETYENSKVEFFEEKVDEIPFEISYMKYFMDKKTRESTFSFFYDFYMLFMRNTLINYRNKRHLFFKLGVVLVISALIGALYSEIGHGISGIENRLGFFNLCNLCITNGSAIFSMMIFAENHKIFMHERSNNMYYLPSYYLAKVTSEIPVCMIMVSIFSYIYIIVGLNDTFSYKYFSFILTMLFCSLGGVSYTCLFGSMVTDKRLLTNLMELCISVLTQVSGYFASPQNYLFYFKGLTYISIQYHALKFLSFQEFSEMQPLSCSLDQTSLGNCDPFANRVAYLQYPYYEVLYNIMLVFVFNFIAYLIFLIKSKKKN